MAWAGVLGTKSAGVGNNTARMENWISSLFFFLGGILGVVGT